MDTKSFDFVNISKEYFKQMNNFNCGNHKIDKFLKNESQAYHEFYANKSSTKLLIYKNAVLGFYTTKLDEFYDKETEEVFYIVYLTHIAVDKKYQKIGIGQFILETFLSKASEVVEFLGLMGIALKAVPDKVEWYKKMVF